MKKGFTFGEILAIVLFCALIGLVIFFVVSPTNVLEKSRDAQRSEDLKVLAAALNSYLAQGNDFRNLSDAYSSIDPGFSSDKAREHIDGTGWLPLNFAGLSNQPSLSVLPIDPLNNTRYYYRVGISGSANTYEIDATFESIENQTKQSADDGSNPAVFEFGTDLTIL